MCKIVIIERIDEEEYEMNKIKQISLSALACLSLGGALVTVNSLGEHVPTVVAASREDTTIANRDIASYLANCQQYESNDKQFQGFTSIKQIQYLGNRQIKITVNDDFYRLTKPRRDLLIDSLQNGVIGTLMNDQQERPSESDVHQGMETKVYLNNQLIGQSSKSNKRIIDWNK